MLSPGGMLLKQLQRGPIEYIYLFHWCRKLYWHFQIYGGWEVFLKSWNCLSPGGMQLPSGPIEYFFHFMGVGNGTDTINLLPEICRFEILKMLYPPKGLCKAGPMGSILILSIGIWHFQFTCGNSPKKNLKMFYSLKGLCKADTEGGPIVFTYVLFCVRKTILDFQFVGGILPFWYLENVLSHEGASACRLQ